MSSEVINLKEKLAKFSDHWSPKVIAELNDYQFKLSKLKGTFPWHTHRHTDEAFLILEGELYLSLRDREVHLQKGEVFVVPKGVEHQPHCEEECHVMLIEPRGVLNTGEVEGEMTAPNDVWI